MEPQQNPAPAAPINNPAPTPTPAPAPAPVTPPPVTPPEPQKRGTLIAIIAVIVAVLIIAAIVYFVSVKRFIANEAQVKSVVTPAPFNDSDLKVEYAPKPVQNSVQAFDGISEKIDRTDYDTLVKYVSSTTATTMPPLAPTQKILAKYTDVLKVLDQTANLPYSCSTALGEKCNLDAIRKVAILGTARALISIEQNKYSDAEKTGNEIVSLGKNMTAASSDLMSLLIGWVAQKYGYSVLATLNAKKKTVTISDADKAAAITALRNEHKTVLRFEYTRIAEGMDYIDSPDKKPQMQTTDADSESTIAEYRKAIAASPKAWNLNETKKYFYDTFKNMIGHVDLPCGSTYPESLVSTGYNAQNTADENFIGKTLYSVTGASIDTLNVKRCDVETTLQMI